MNTFNSKGLKAQAKRLQSAVAALVGTPVRLSTALELVARSHGFRNWDTAANSVPRGQPAGPVQEAPALQVRRVVPADDLSHPHDTPWLSACLDAIINGVPRPLILISGSTNSGRTSALELLAQAVAGTRAPTSNQGRQLNSLVVSEGSQMQGSGRGPSSSDVEATAQSVMRRGAADLVGVDINDHHGASMAFDFVQMGYPAVALVLNSPSADLALARFNALVGPLAQLPAAVTVLSVHCAQRHGAVDSAIDWKLLRSGAGN